MEKECILYIFDSFDRDLKSFISALGTTSESNKILFETKIGIGVKSKRGLGLVSLALGLGILVKLEKEFDTVKIVSNDETSMKILKGEFNPNRLRNNRLISDLVAVMSAFDKVLPSDVADTDMIDRCLNNLITKDYVELPSVEESYCELYRKTI